LRKKAFAGTRIFPVFSQSSQKLSLKMHILQRKNGFPMDGWVGSVFWCLKKLNIYRQTSSARDA
jgi:hypothetical protein